MKQLGAFLFCVAFCLFQTAITASAQEPVPLGAAAPFAVLAGSGITNTGPTTITGDVGSHPTTAQTGFDSVTLSGTNHGGDAVTQGAKIALRSAFLNAAGRGPTLVVGGGLGGRVLTPGVYKDNGAPASLGLTGTLRLDAQGNQNAVFIFQSASTLITEVGSSVVLMNGARACNVFWQVGSAATLKTSTTFVGTILANDDISVQASVTIAGRLLAGAQANSAGAVTLINDTITTSGCGASSGEADLTIKKSHSGNFVQDQIGAAYTLAASNVGLGPTVGTVTVSDTLPAGLAATAMSGTGWSCTLTSLSCTRSDSLAAGASFAPITVTVNVATTAAAITINTAAVSGGGETNLSNNSASDTTTIMQATGPLPDLTITKSHSGNFQQGGSGTYTLTVKNIGPAPTSGGVTVSDTLPAGLTATAISGTGWTCTLTSTGCTRSDSLAAGATYPPVTVTVNVANNPVIGSQAGEGITFQPGDILLSMRDGTVQWRRHDWTLIKIIPSATDGQAKGTAFDTLGNLFLTHYFGTGLSDNNVVKFDRNGNLIGLFGSGYDCNPSSIMFDNTGTAYIGQADCSADIFKLDSQGNRLARYDVAVENRGSDHILLDPDQCTMYYTSQGAHVKRFNVCTNTQMPDFNSAPLPDTIGGAHQFALLPGGGLLVANFSVIVLLDASGKLVRTYNVPAESHCWLGMALDPDGTSFWATNWCGSSATRLDIVTGNVIENHVAADAGFMVKQIIVAPPELRGTVLINTAAVSGGGEVNISNNLASDPTTTMITLPQTPVLSIGSAYCVGTAWSLGVTNAVPNASVRLMGTTNGLPWTVGEWAATDANGNFGLGGAFAAGTEGSYTLRVGINRKMSNTISFVVSDCRR